LLLPCLLGTQFLTGQGFGRAWCAWFLSARKALVRGINRTDTHIRFVLSTLFSIRQVWKSCFGRVACSGIKKPPPNFSYQPSGPPHWRGWLHHMRRWQSRSALYSLLSLYRTIHFRNYTKSNRPVTLPVYPGYNVKMKEVEILKIVLFRGLKF